MLNKLVDKCNNSYYCSVGKKPNDTDYSALSEEIEMDVRATTFKVGDRVRITKCKDFFSKGYTENCSREIFVIDSVMKTNVWVYKIKYLKREKNNRKFL